ncbi:MAG: tetratricopeptide repeat protein, partial [bacterium]
AADAGGWRADRETSGLDAAAARAWAGEAFAAYRAGALDQAAQLLQAARERLPGDATICFRLGIVERARGRYNDARAAFELALGIDPSMTSARDALRAISESLERGKE